MGEKKNLTGCCVMLRKSSVTQSYFPCGQV